MYIAKQRINNTTYVYEQSSYRDKKTGEIKTKRKICGKLDENNDFIPSKGRTLNNLPAQIVVLTKITKEIRVVEKKETRS